MIRHTVYEHEFGLLLPCKSGVAWEHQTEGVLCSHIFIEGVFLPLSMPQRALDRLQQENYKGRHRSTATLRSIWQEIDKTLFFRYKRTGAPSGKPPNQEGIQWIKIAALKRVVDGYRLTDWDFKARQKSYKGLIGRTVALIYPNCD
jgi:hypothetical protein